MASREKKSQPFSIRLRAEDDRFVAEESRRLRRPRGSLVQEYTAESIRSRRYPGIGFRGDDYRRRAWVIGTGLDVWELVTLVRDFGGESAVAAEYELAASKIRLALAYAEEFEDEIAELVEDGRRTEAELAARHPFISSYERATTAGGA